MVSRSSSRGIICRRGVACSKLRVKGFGLVIWRFEPSRLTCIGCGVTLGFTLRGIRVTWVRGSLRRS